MHRGENRESKLAQRHILVKGRERERTGCRYIINLCRYRGIEWKSRRSRRQVERIFLERRACIL